MIRSPSSRRAPKSKGISKVHHNHDGQRPGVNLIVEVFRETLRSVGAPVTDEIGLRTLSGERK